MARLSGVGTALAVLCLAAGVAYADTAESLLARSKAAELAGHRDTAIRYAQAAIVADPAHTTAYNALADLYMRDDHSDFAQFYYGEALAIDPQDLEAKQGIALAERNDETRAAAAAGSLDNEQGRH